MTRPVLAVLAAFALPLVLTLGYFFTMVQVMGWDFRFSFPSLPFVVVPAALCLDRFLACRQGWSPRLAAIGKRVLLILPLAVLFWIAQEPLSRAYARRFLRPAIDPAAAIPPASGQFRRLDWWAAIQAMSGLCARLPEGTLVAASEHGLVAARNPHVRILDLTGLHDPVIARRGLHAGYLEQRAPALIWLPHEDYYSLRREILESGFFRREYVYFPSALNYGLAVRRDRTDVLNLVRADLEAQYRRPVPPLRP